MSFFFFAFEESPDFDAPKAYREALRRDAVSGVEMAKRAGVTRGAIGKFLAGRPLTSNMLKALRPVMTKESASRLLLAHLRDEIRRAGENPNQFTVVEHDRFGPVLQKILEQLPADPERVRELIELSAKWERDSLTAALNCPRGSAPATGAPSPARKSRKQRKSKREARISESTPERMVD